MNAKKAKELRRSVYKMGTRHEDVVYEHLAHPNAKGSHLIAVGKRGVYRALKHQRRIPTCPR
jgi:hypothetical protein